MKLSCRKRKKKYVAPVPAKPTNPQALKGTRNRVKQKAGERSAQPWPWEPHSTWGPFPQQRRGRRHGERKPRVKKTWRPHTQAKTTPCKCELVQGTHTGHETAETGKWPPRTTEGARQAQRGCDRDGARGWRGSVYESTCDSLSTCAW